MNEKVLAIAIADIENIHEYFDNNEYPTSIVMTNYDYDSLPAESQQIIDEQYRKTKLNDVVTVYYPGIFFADTFRNTFKEYDFIKCPSGVFHEISGYSYKRKKDPEVVVKSLVIDHKKNVYPNKSLTLADIKNYYYNNPDFIEKGDENYYAEKITTRNRRERRRNLIKGR